MVSGTHLGIGYLFGDKRLIAEEAPQAHMFLPCIRGWARAVATAGCGTDAGASDNVGALRSVSMPTQDHGLER